MEEPQGLASSASPKGAYVFQAIWKAEGRLEQLGRDTGERNGLADIASGLNRRRKGHEIGARTNPLRRLGGAGRAIVCACRFSRGRYATSATPRRRTPCGAARCSPQYGGPRLGARSGGLERLVGRREKLPDALRLRDHRQELHGGLFRKPPWCSCVASRNGHTLRDRTPRYCPARSARSDQPDRRWSIDACRCGTGLW